MVVSSKIQAAADKAIKEEAAFFNVPFEEIKKTTNWVAKTMEITYGSLTFEDELIGLTINWWNGKHGNKHNSWNGTIYFTKGGKTVHEDEYGNLYVKR